MWSGDVAALAFINQVLVENSDGESNLSGTAHVDEYEPGVIFIDKTDNVTRITFGIKLYGPIQVSALLLAHVY
jgi:hypothetical protein